MGGSKGGRGRKERRMRGREGGLAGGREGGGPVGSTAVLIFLSNANSLEDTEHSLTELTF